MVSIKVKNDGDNNRADVCIGMQGEFDDIVAEIVIGAVAAFKKATGGMFTYQAAAAMLQIALAEFEDFEEFEEG